MNVFEDAGYFCVDNLPAEMIRSLAELFRHSGSKVERAAVVSDSRGGEYLSALAGVIDELDEAEIVHRVLFLESDEQTLLNRYKETRRRHPLAPHGSVVDGIRRERELLGAGARAGRLVHRHQRAERGRAAAQGRRRAARAGHARPPRRHLHVVRPQARPAARRRPRARRPLPAQPALRGRPAAADRVRPADRRLRRPRRPAGGVLRPRAAAARVPAPAVRRRGQGAPRRGDRLHRRPPPLGRDRRAPRGRVPRPRRVLRRGPAPRRRPASPVRSAGSASAPASCLRARQSKGIASCPYASGSTASAASAATCSAPHTSRTRTSRSSPSTTSPTPATLAHLLKYDSVYGPFPGTVEVRDGALADRRPRGQGARRARPGRAAVGRPRRRRRDRVDRLLHQARRRRQAPRGRRQEGDHLRAGHRAGRHRRARRQLRRRLRRRQPPRHLQRVVHDQLPGAGGEGAARDDRDRARPDDHDPRVHGRPAPAGRAAQGPPARPRGRDQPRARLDRRRQGDRPRDPRAPGQAARLRRARARADRLGRRPHRRRSRARPASTRSTTRSARAPTPARFTGILQYTEDPIVSSDIVKSPLLVDLRLRADRR